MKKEKILIRWLLICILSLSSMVSYAMENNKVIPTKEYTMQPVNETMIMPQYAAFSGTVREITQSTAQPGSYIVNTVNEQGQEANIILSSETYIVDNVKFAVGDDITIFYDATKPMILIYPPQYNAEVAVLTPKDQFVKYDLFDKNLVSSDGMLKLLISEDTPVYSKDGSSYKGDFGDKRLVVFYTRSTKSIPAQTQPDRVIVLSDETIEDTKPVRMGIIQLILKKLFGIGE